MQVQELSAYDVAPETIEAFRAAIGDSLLPAQELALREGLLACPAEGQSRNLLIAAPTSAGKTFIGEMAAVHAAQKGRRAFYLVPLKAMAEEVYRTIAARYQGLDLKVVISTRDHRDFDEQIESGSFHIAVMVYEKLQSMLVTRPELLGQVGLIVIDELQMLTDQGRGPKLELLLTKIRKVQQASQKGLPQLCCLSAPVAGLATLGAWLSAHVVIDERRPVELRAGVIHRGHFLYRSSRGRSIFAPLDEIDSPRLEEEIYDDPGEKDGRDVRRQLQRTVAALAIRGEQTLVFLPDKASSLQAARELCEAMEGLCAPAGWAIDDMSGTDSGQAREALLHTLRSGVAFHNSDLTQAQRDIIERAFRRGEIRVLCATSTLAMGVNLPAKNVILAERWKWRYSRRYNKWVRDELAKVEYDGMSGRAGRLGLCGGPSSPSSYGRSLLIAPSRFDAEVWMRTLVDAPAADLEPTLLGKPLGDVVLDLCASELCRDEVEIIDFLLSTFTGHVRWSRQPGQQAFARSIGLTIEELVRNDLLLREESGRLSITAVGRVCARKGLMVRSAVLMSRWADAAAPKEVRFTELEVLLVCALTPDGGEAHVPLSLPEHRFGDYWTRILLKAQELGAQDRKVFRWLREQRGRLTYEQTKSVKKALLLLDWVDSHDSTEIERDHSVWSGAVSHAAADFAWLAEAQREICDARGWPSERTAELSCLAERLRYGVPGNLLPLARATTRVLSRTHLQKVAAAGVDSEEGLLSADPQTLEQALGHRGILQKIFQIQAARAAMKGRAPGAPAPVKVPQADAVVMSMPLAARRAQPVQVPVPATDGIIDALSHPEVDQAAVELGEPGHDARLVPKNRNLVPAGADLPLDQVLVQPGKPAVPLMSEPVVSIDPEMLAAATARPVLQGAVPALRPVIVRKQRAPVAGEEQPEGRRQMVLSPEAGPRKCYVLFGDTRVALSPGSFALLARLALGTPAPAQAPLPGETGASQRGWVSKEQLGKTAAGVRKSISRLRTELRRVNIEARSWVENDGRGHYRLSLLAPHMVVDREALRRHPMAMIRAALRAA